MVPPRPVVRNGIGGGGSCHERPCQRRSNHSRGGDLGTLTEPTPPSPLCLRTGQSPQGSSATRWSQGALFCIGHSSTIALHSISEYPACFIILVFISQCRGAYHSPILYVPLMSPPKKGAFPLFLCGIRYMSPRYLPFMGLDNYGAPCGNIDVNTLIIYSLTWFCYATPLHYSTPLCRRLSLKIDEDQSLSHLYSLRGAPNPTALKRGRWAFKAGGPITGMHGKRTPVLSPTETFPAQHFDDRRPPRNQCRRDDGDPATCLDKDLPNWGTARNTPVSPHCPASSLPIMRSAASALFWIKKGHRIQHTMEAHK